MFSACPPKEFLGSETSFTNCVTSSSVLRLTDLIKGVLVTIVQNIWDEYSCSFRRWECLIGDKFYGEDTKQGRGMWHHPGRTPNDGGGWDNASRGPPNGGGGWDITLGCPPKGDEAEVDSVGVRTNDGAGGLPGKAGRSAGGGGPERAAKVGGACCGVSLRGAVGPRHGRSGGWRTPGEKLF
jgi:hypothetical protein